LGFHRGRLTPGIGIRKKIRVWSNEEYRPNCSGKTLKSFRRLKGGKNQKTNVTKDGKRRSVLIVRKGEENQGWLEK